MVNGKPIDYFQYGKQCNSFLTGKPIDLFQNGEPIE